MFARAGEPEPNYVVGERLQPPQARPRREASRTLAEARELGLSMPEALDLTPDEIAAEAGVPPGSPPDRRRRPKRASKGLGAPAEGFGGPVGMSHLTHLCAVLPPNTTKPPAERRGLEDELARLLPRERHVAILVVDDGLPVEIDGAGGPVEVFNPVHRGLQRQERLRQFAVKRCVEKRCGDGHFEAYSSAATIMLAWTTTTSCGSIWSQSPVPRIWACAPPW